MSFVSIVLFAFLTTGSLGHAESGRVERIYFAGAVNSRTVDALLAKVQRAKEQGAEEVIVVLDSPGGDLQAALRGAETLRSLGVDTEVDGGRSCDSSCTVLYTAGQRRYAHDNSRFLFHPVHVEPWGKDKEGRNVRLTQEQQQRYRDSFASKWEDQVRRVAPPLADDLSKNRTLRDGRQTYYNDLNGEQESGYDYTGRQLRDSGYVNDDPRRRDQPRPR